MTSSSESSIHPTEAKVPRLALPATTDSSLGSLATGLDLPQQLPLQWEAEEAAKAAASEGEELRKELMIPQELVRQNMLRAEVAVSQAQAAATSADADAGRAVSAAFASEQSANAAKSRMESTFTRLCTLTEGIDSRCERLSRLAAAASAAAV